MTPPDDATLQALIRMAAPTPTEPIDFTTGAPRRQSSDLSQALQQMDALRKQIPVSFKAKKGGGVITYKGRF